jgi:hypothetical protein
MSIDLEDELANALQAKEKSEGDLERAVKELELTERTIAMTHEAIRMVRDTIGLVVTVVSTEGIEK